MSNTPSRAEIEALVKRHGATSYRNRADTQHPAYGFTEDGLNGLIDEVLARWGDTKGAPLTDEQINGLIAAKHFREGYKLTASDKVCINWYRLGLRDGERAHGITKKRGQHGTE